MNEPTAAYIIMIMVGTAIGYLWGHYIGSKSDYSLEWDAKNKIAQLEAENERLGTERSIQEELINANYAYIAQLQKERVDREAIGGEG